MTPTKTAAPPKSKAAPPPVPASRNRVILIGAAAIGLALVIWLIVSATAGGSGPGTTSTTSPVTGALAFRNQITTSYADSVKIFSTFKSVTTSCQSDLCIENAAATALNSEGTTANLVHQTSFPTLARNSGQAYVTQLIQIQYGYRSLSIGAVKSDLSADLEGIAKVLSTAHTDALVVEADL